MRTLGDALLFVTLGALIGIWFAASVDDDEMQNHIKAGVFEKDGTAYHIEVMPK